MPPGPITWAGLPQRALGRCPASNAGDRPTWGRPHTADVGNTGSEQWLTFGERLRPKGCACAGLLAYSSWNKTQDGGGGGERLGNAADISVHRPSVLHVASAPHTSPHLMRRASKPTSLTRRGGWGAKGESELFPLQTGRGDSLQSHLRSRAAPSAVATGPALLPSGNHPAAQATPLFKERNRNWQFAFLNSVGREDN